VEHETGFAWALIVGMALTAFMLRAAFVLPGSRLRLPPRVEQVLRYAPAAALMAIIVPDVAMSQGTLAIAIHNPRFVAGVVAFAVAVATRSIILTILAGMLVLTAVRLLVS
jgi:branched-subunit amino acid transport protein